MSRSRESSAPSEMRNFLLSGLSKKPFPYSSDLYHRKEWGPLVDGVGIGYLKLCHGRRHVACL